MRSSSVEVMRANKLDAISNPNVTPSIEDLGSAVEESVNKRIALYSKIVATETDLIKKNRAKEDLLEAESLYISFKKLMIDKKIPEGFEVKPVFFEKISVSQNAAVWDEFATKVRWKVRKFFASERADELREWGICECGINLMKEGKHPLDSQGNLYNVSIDHEKERAGGGRDSLEKARDEITGEFTFKINHIKNLKLLPNPIHDLKNDLNEIQMTSSLPEGTGRWVLMLLPKAGMDYVPKLKDAHVYKIKPKAVKVQKNALDENMEKAQILTKEFEKAVEAGEREAAGIIADLMPRFNKFYTSLVSHFNNVARRNVKDNLVKGLKNIDKVLNSPCLFEMRDMMSMLSLDNEVSALRGITVDVRQVLERNTVKKPNKSNKKLKNNP